MKIAWVRLLLVVIVWDSVEFSFMKRRKQINTRIAVLISLDIEKYESDHVEVFKFGQSIYDPNIQHHSAIPDITAFHVRIEENSDLINRK